MPAHESDIVPGHGVDPRLLELLVCPLTKTRLEYDASKQELISRAAGLAFPIKNGVPLLIADAGRPLEDADAAPRPRAPRAG